MISKGYIFDEIKLDIIKFYAESVLSREHLPGCSHEINVVLDAVLNNFIFTLESKIIGQKLVTKTITYPLNWWEAVKERFAPAWFLKQCPVIYKQHILDAAILYPDLKIKLPDEQNVFYMKTYTALYKE